MWPCRTRTGVDSRNGRWWDFSGLRTGRRQQRGRSCGHTLEDAEGGHGRVFKGPMPKTAGAMAPEAQFSSMKKRLEQLGITREGAVSECVPCSPLTSRVSIVREYPTNRILYALH